MGLLLDQIHCIFVFVDIVELHDSVVRNISKDVKLVEEICLGFVVTLYKGLWDSLGLENFFVHLPFHSVNLNYIWATFAKELRPTVASKSKSA